MGATGGTGRLIVNTNLSFGEWSAVFGDARKTASSPIVGIPKLTIACCIAPATDPADTLRFKYTNKGGRNFD